MNRHEHLMTRSMEECCEVAQRVSKALIFGMQEVQPGQTLTNHERIRGEFCDLVAVLDMIDPALTAFSGEELEAKKAKVEKYLRYSGECSTLSPSQAAGSSPAPSPQDLRVEIERLVKYFSDCRDSEMAPSAIATRRGLHPRGSKIEIKSIRKTLNVVVCELEKALAVPSGSSPAPSSLPPRDSGDAALIDSLTELVYWALGERGPFPEQRDSKARYWWRRELRQRFESIVKAAVPSSAASSVSAAGLPTLEDGEGFCERSGIPEPSSVVQGSKRLRAVAEELQL